MRTFLLVTTILFHINLNIQAQSSSLQEDLMLTIGYFLAQEEQLKQIEKEYPELSIEIEKTKSLWNIKFGDATDNIEKIISTEVGNDNWLNLKEELIRKLREKRNFELSKTEAALYLNAIQKERCKGNIESPILEILLTYKPSFQEQPDLEIREGYKKSLKTHKIENANGLKLEFNIPKSWSFKKGKRSHIIYSFASRFKTESGALEIHSLSKTTGIPKEEFSKYSPKEIADELLTTETMEAIPKNIPGLVSLSQFESKKGIIDKCYGAMASFVSTIERMDFSVTQYQKSYIILYEDYMINFTFVVFKEKSEPSKSFEERIEKYSELYKYIINSIIIHNQY